MYVLHVNQPEISLRKKESKQKHIIAIHSFIHSFAYFPSCLTSCLSQLIRCHQLQKQLQQSTIQTIPQLNPIQPKLLLLYHQLHQQMYLMIHMLIRKENWLDVQLKANPLKYKVWLIGHISALIFGSISFIFQIFWLPNYYYINSISYRLSLIGSIAALTATFSHKFGLHNLPNIGTLLSHQNFQYLVLASIWILHLNPFSKFYLILY